MGVIAAYAGEMLETRNGREREEGAALRKVVLWSAEEVLAGGEMVWVCEGYIINRLRGRGRKFQPVSCCLARVEKSNARGLCFSGFGWGRRLKSGWFGVKKNKRGRGEDGGISREWGEGRIRW